MSAVLKTTKSMAVGAILAASVGCATSSTGPSPQLSLSAAAPASVQSAYSSWVSGAKLASDAKEHCYGVSLKGQNDCGAASGTSCKGDMMASGDCKSSAGMSCKGDKMASGDCKASAGMSCKGDKMASGDCKSSAGMSCKGDKMASGDCKSSAGITCSGNASVDWQGDAWMYVPKGSCEMIVTPAGMGSLKPK
ncbi:MAG: DUF2282 domain-containing protein [Robiginitomaculum sp.]